MKLPYVEFDLELALSEFDIWITPSLSEITDSTKFKEELNRIVSTFNLVGNATNNFSSKDACSPESIAATYTEALANKEQNEREQLLQSLGSTLFLVTGKSDNNFKCQFPLFLRDVAQWQVLPIVRGTKNKKITNRPLPRVIKSDDYMSLIAKIDDSHLESKLLEKFISFLLKDEKSINQLWGIGYSYFALKQFRREKDLLSPMVIFKVRGSVTASGGHEPEDALRQFLEIWGLEAGIDYNLNDVVVLNNEENSDDKTRGFDFVLPYLTKNWYKQWQKRLFVQCQFYAGDSGSVSHKNLDQTVSSRSKVLGEIEDARFIEYVDGAGYFSSLNGDLRKLLTMENTHSFFQVRTAPIRLRRELQNIGFITPLEIEHAIARSDGKVDSVRSVLVNEGYKKSEIDRAINNAIEREIILQKNSSLFILESRRNIVRRYFLLDVAAIFGNPVDMTNGGGAGCFLVPGYGPFFGLPLDDLVSIASNQSEELKRDILNSKVLLEDIRMLCNEGIAMAR